MGKMLNTRAGRDKMFRTWGYGTKTVIALLEQCDSQDKELNAKLAAMAKNLSEGRRTWRLFIFLNNWLSMIKAIRGNKGNPVLRGILIAKTVVNLIFAFLDNYVWLGKVGLVKMDVKARNRQAMQFWFYGAVLGAVAALS
eukprot:TRINITY_DN18708_c0_g1_i1.p1 TRINITY_DN18708_c0_g1~~TRINITY_DN18708_c0_g1_i1.p1  ORF type:complete len:161 (-),score=35.97 TRINITY_DN18708_c0_g1_i1:145-564(-)